MANKQIIKCIEEAVAAAALLAVMVGGPVFVLSLERVK